MVFKSILLWLRHDISFLYVNLKEQPYLWRFDFKIKRSDAPCGSSRARISRGSQKEKLPSWSLRKTLARVNFLLVLLVSSSFLRIQERKRWCTLQFYGRCHAFFLPEMTTTVTLRDEGDRYEPSEVFWSPYKQRIFLSGLCSRAKRKWNSERY